MFANACLPSTVFFGQPRLTRDTLFLSTTGSSIAGGGGIVVAPEDILTALTARHVERLNWDAPNAWRLAQNPCLTFKLTLDIAIYGFCLW